MVDNLTDKMHREWNLTNTDANYVDNSASTRHLLQPQPLSRKSSDHNNSQQHHHTHHQSIQSPPIITTTDYSDASPLSAMGVKQFLFDRRSPDAGYDTDGGIGTTASKSKLPNQRTHGYEHFVSPRLPPRRSVRQPSKQSPTIPSQQHSSPYTHLTVNSTSGAEQHHDDKVEEPVRDGNSHRRHIRLSRKIQPRSRSKKNHGTSPTHSSTVPRHDGALATTSSGRPFRLIFMRHSERVNQALGSDWFSKAFRTNTYKSYDQNLPIALPKRYSDQAYEFDAPITGFYFDIYIYIAY
jgi:hypothetical protein